MDGHQALIVRRLKQFDPVEDTESTYRSTWWQRTELKGYKGMIQLEDIVDAGEQVTGVGGRRGKLGC